MTKRGLFSALFVAISLLGMSSFAMAPTIRELPDVTISDNEDNIGSDNNWFVYTSAFEFDKYAQDGDTTLSQLLWSFDEGDPDTGWFSINGLTAVHVGDTGIASDSPTIPSAHQRPDLEVPQKNIRLLSTATFRDIVFSPLSGSPPFPNPTEDHETTGKLVRFYVSDGGGANNVATQDIIVNTIDNTPQDSLSGGTCFDVDQTRIYLDDETFNDNVVSFTSGGTSGWTVNNPDAVSQGLANCQYDATNKAIRVTVIASSTKNRINGLQAANDRWLPYSAVSSTIYNVRTKWYIFCTGQTNPNDLNQIPNFRIRAGQRFAVNAMLEVFNHLSSFPATATLAPELRPSNDPNNPSVYRVDHSPVRVSAMNNAGEGINRAFESYSLATEPQEVGSIECTESIIGKYRNDTCIENETQVQSYATSPSDAGDLKIVSSASDFSRSLLIGGAAIGDPATGDTTQPGNLPSYTENNTGVSFSSSLVPTNRIGVGSREFDSGHFTNALTARVAAGKQYRLVWKVTSTSNANTNPQVRLRARTLGFLWGQKLEIGGALAGGGSNQTIARQALPGVGTEISSGFYTQIMHTPISTEIQASQPNINAQPGFGNASTSRKDIKVGFDIVDTLSGSPVETGNFKIESIQIFESDLVSD